MRLRVLLALPAVVLLTAATGLLVILVGLVPGSGRIAHRIVAAWGRAVLRIAGVEVHVSGAEHVPAGPAVYAVNHASVLDIPIVFGCLPVDFRIIHKRSLYLIPIVGQALWVGGHIGIDRGRAFRARRSLEAAARRIASGTSVVVFPEGTRSPDQGVLPFKKGSFVLAIDAGVPIVPVSLAGVKRLVPQGVLSLAPGTIELRVHAAVATSGRSADDAVTLAGEVRQVVAAGCAA